ncbi:4'-phosphopantetheinyl transferase family protein [Halioxenophilus aromaticivorans]|uniref:4'-phosphopantetheinyl transferase n=1 Tax=Halioxenophilus aromaticivorans TaxID=1306992 RepID=A0AAV3U1A7_9ALTE
MHEPSIFLCHYSDWNMAHFQHRFLPTLNAEDQVRFERFRHVDASHQFLIGRSLLRHALSQALQQAPESFCFSQNKNGRPELAGSSINFNVSHTEGLVAVTLAEAPLLGIDVESAQRSGSTLEIADRFFHPKETAAITAPNQEAQQRENFFRFWTLKEAYVKALGDGLQRSLQSFYFTLRQQQVDLQDEKVPGNNRATHIYQYRVADNYFCTWASIDTTNPPMAPRFYSLSQDFTASPLMLAPEYRSAPNL